jgi:hypothetical protein
VTNGSYAVRSVLSAYSGLEVQGATYDEFYVELVALLGADRARRYLQFRIWQIDQEMDAASGKAKATPAVAAQPQADTVTPEQGLQNVKGDTGSYQAPVNDTAPPCAGHGIPKKKSQVKKDGPNKNRYFFACAKPQGQQCDNSFEWVK